MKNTLRIIFLAAVLNLGVTNTIDAFKHPKLTRTELFLRIPQTYFWDFKQVIT